MHFVGNTLKSALLTITGMKMFYFLRDCEPEEEGGHRLVQETSQGVTVLL